MSQVREAAGGVIEAAARPWPGQQKPKAMSWLADWIQWEEPVKQTMVQYFDRLEMRLAPFNQAFTISSVPQDYTGKGFVGWLSDVVNGGPRSFYVTFWRWPRLHPFPLHHHEWMEYHFLVYGLIEYNIAGERMHLAGGRGLRIFPNLVHGGVAVEDSLLCMLIEQDARYEAILPYC